MSAGETRPLGALGRMGVVAAFHVGIVFVIANSFGLMPKAQVLPPDIETEIFEKPVIDEHPPEPRDFVPERTERLTLPEPEHPPIASEPAETAITAELRPIEEIPIEVGSAQPVPEIIGPRVDPRRPVTQPRYPAESKRSGEEGLVVLRVLINELGRAARVDIERSSGHIRLDEAARSAVQRALFRPYVENGVARMALATIPIEFTWKSRRADKSTSRG